MPRPSSRARSTRQSLLDAHKPTIRRLLDHHPYSAVQLFARLRADEGYTGGLSILKDYVRLVRPVRAPGLPHSRLRFGRVRPDRLGYAGRMQIGSTTRRVVFLGLVGLGKTHLATALGYAACARGFSVLFANAIEVINTLSAAQTHGRLQGELRRYLSPDLLILDELGYLPVDQRGADLLFQVLSQRYERGSVILTSNKAFKAWPSIFNNDSTVTSAVLDRVLHHCETVLIEGNRFRMKDRIEPV